MADEERKVQVEPEIASLVASCEQVLNRVEGIRGCEECLAAAAVYIRAAREIAQNKIPMNMVVSDADEAASRAEQAILEMEDKDVDWYLERMKAFACPKCGRESRVFVPDDTSLLDTYPPERLSKCYGCGEVLVIFADGLRFAK